jgi:cytoplasmic iron level regulating protein YaaA (DUF328/UPF0246 family)
VRLAVDGAARHHPGRDVGDRVEDAVAVPAALDVQRLVEVAGPGWIDGHERHVDALALRLPGGGGGRLGLDVGGKRDGNPGLGTQGVEAGREGGGGRDARAAGGHGPHPTSSRRFSGTEAPRRRLDGPPGGRRVAWRAVLILLPPSEGKAVPPGGPPVALEALVHPELAPQRERLLTTVERLGRGSVPVGLKRLGIGPGLVGELERNATLRSAPAAPAAEVYTGVLFQHLGLGSLGAAARARADERVLVASALWGVVRLADRIPAYRLSMGADLPRLPGLARWWAPALARALPPGGLVVDCRSASYAAAWRPAEAHLVEIRAFTADGKVVSHMAKATRGDIARLLVEAPAAPTDPEGVAAVAEAAGLRVALANAGRAWQLDVHLR